MRALSDYAIGERLGAGSFGETFAAVHQPSGREVAIKVLRIKDAPDWKAIELFEREGETLARLSHPGIAAYLDAFVVTEEGAGEAFYLVQERIFGGSLGARLARGEVMTAAEVTGLLRELARVLEYIHGVNPPVIHRDLKPSNIMCRSNTDQLRFALIDFGAIQIALPRADGQAGSTIIGTTGYMPTEQLLGRTGPASDLYALGATAVHALTGVHPAEMAIKRLRLEWREHLPSATNLPDQLGAVLDALLAPAVEDRIASGAELIRRLNIRQAIKGTPPAPAPSKALPMGLKAFFGLTLGLGTLFILALAVLSLSDDPQDTYVQDHPIGLILEDEHPSILPIRLETVADLARAMGPGVELPDEALKVTLRGFRNDTYPAAAILIENTSKRAWSKVRVAWFLMRKKTIRPSRSPTRILSRDTRAPFSQMRSWASRSNGVRPSPGPLTSSRGSLAQNMRHRSSRWPNPLRSPGLHPHRMGSHFHFSCYHLAVTRRTSRRATRTCRVSPSPMSAPCLSRHFGYTSTSGTQAATWRLSTRTHGPSPRAPRRCCPVRRAPSQSGAGRTPRSRSGP